MEIKRSHDRLISSKGFPTLVRCDQYNESGLRKPHCYGLSNFGSTESAYQAFHFVCTMNDVFVLSLHPIFSIASIKVTAA